MFAGPKRFKESDLGLCSQISQVWFSTMPPTGFVTSSKLFNLSGSLGGAGWGNDDTSFRELRTNGLPEVEGLEYHLPHGAELFFLISACYYEQPYYKKERRF